MRSSLYLQHLLLEVCLIISCARRNVVDLETNPVQFLLNRFKERRRAVSIRICWDLLFASFSRILSHSAPRRRDGFDSGRFENAEHHRSEYGFVWECVHCDPVLRLFNGLVWRVRWDGRNGPIRIPSHQKNSKVVMA